MLRTNGCDVTSLELTPKDTHDAVDTARTCGAAALASARGAAHGASGGDASAALPMPTTRPGGPAVAVGALEVGTSSPSTPVARLIQERDMTITQLQAALDASRRRCALLEAQGGGVGGPSGGDGSRGGGSGGVGGALAAQQASILPEHSRGLQPAAEAAHRGSVDLQGRERRSTSACERDALAAGQGDGGARGGGRAVQCTAIRKRAANVRLVSRQLGLHRTLSLSPQEGKAHRDRELRGTGHQAGALSGSHHEGLTDSPAPGELGAGCGTDRLAGTRGGGSTLSGCDRLSGTRGAGRTAACRVK
eukprot:365130-Chlamydomonas_euryale.AAC.21